MKYLALEYEINTPKYYFAYNEKDIKLADRIIGTYPMFVKHFNGNDSIGITPHSKVGNFDEMKLMAQKFIFEHGGALIEEYIDGREFTVLVIENDKNKNEPFVLDPVESLFLNGDSFYHFDVKWNNTNQALTRMKMVDKKLPLRDKLVDMAKKAFINMYSKGYARIDMRCDKSETLYFLEINNVPTTFWHKPDENYSDFIIKNNLSFKPEEIVYHIIYLGVCKHKNRNITYE